ncbi:hypothetical protein OAT67_04900 [Bacteriovoracaceae bacterium]|nr:hypothetical protein [Bacteriovoracaceae bacterium]
MALIIVSCIVFFSKPFNGYLGSNSILDRFKVTILEEIDKQETPIEYDHNYVIHSITEGNRISLAFSGISQVKNSHVTSGFGYPKNGQFINKRGDNGNFFTGHCYIIDMLISFGYLFGLLATIIWWGPIVIITKMFFNPRRTFSLFTVKEYMFWSFYFSVAFIISLEGIYGFTPHNSAVQIMMIIIFMKVLKQKNETIA